MRWVNLTTRPADSELCCYHPLHCRRAYCSYADALFPPVWMTLTALLASSRLLSFWQLVLVGLFSFWGGMYVMAVRWAGVPTKQLSLSRVAPMLVVSLEVTCFGELNVHARLFTSGLLTLHAHARLIHHLGFTVYTAASWCFSLFNLMAVSCLQVPLYSTYFQQCGWAIQRSACCCYCVV